MAQPGGSPVDHFLNSVDIHKFLVWLGVLPGIDLRMRPITNSPDDENGPAKRPVEQRSKPAARLIAGQWLTKETTNERHSSGRTFSWVRGTINILGPSRPYHPVEFSKSTPKAIGASIECVATVQNKIQ